MPEQGPVHVNVEEVAARLEAAAWAAAEGWLPRHWRRLDGPGPDTVTLEPLRYMGELVVGNFTGLTLPPGQRLVLATDLAIPDRICGVDVRGEPLEMAVYSVYPMAVAVNDRAVFADRTPPVAAGPALFNVLDAITGADGTLSVDIAVPPQQRAFGWLHLRFTTPGLRHREDQLGLLTAQLLLADAIADTDVERRALQAAASLIPELPLSLEVDELDTLVDRVQELLQPLASKLHALDAHLIGHSHIDLAWLWTWEDSCNVIIRDVTSVLSLLDDYPEMKFTHSQPATYAVLQDREPGLFERVKAHITGGRWEPATAQWVEADANMPSGESAARQLIEGVTFSEQELGASPDVLLAPDTFGHAGNLPQIAAAAGVDVYYHHRVNPAAIARDNFWPAYWWEGQDGTRVLALSTGEYLGELNPIQLARALVDGPIRSGYSVAMHVYGVGDHGGGPTRQALDRARSFGKVAAFPSLRCSTVSNYARDLLASGADLPTHRGESGTLFEGCYTTHADSKRLNRHAENALVTAQTLAALADVDERGALSSAWRDVLFHQFHDILDGSAIREAYEKTEDDCTAAIAAAEVITAKSLDVLQAGADGDVVVTNPLGVARTDVVVVPAEGSGPVSVIAGDGTAHAAQWTADGLCFVASIGPFETASFRIAEGDADVPRPALGRPARAANSQAYLSVSTKFFEVVVREDSGIITSLVDRRTGRDLVAFGMRRGSDYVDTARADLALNVLTAMEEGSNPMAAWHLDEVAVEEHLIHGATTRVIEQGPVRVVLEVARTWRSSRIVQKLAFYQDLPRIDIGLDIDWRETGSDGTFIPGLKASFTARLPEVQAWFETPYAAVRRPSDGQESPAIRWAAVGGAERGIAVINDCKYGYDALGGRLRVTLVRNSYSPDSESDTGRHVARLALMPYVGDWRSGGVVDEAAGFNQPLIGRMASRAQLTNHQSWSPTVSAGPVRIGTLDVAASRSGRIVRLYEAHGVGGTVEVTGLGDRATVHEVTLTEQPLGLVDTTDGTATLTFTPWQMRTLLVER